MFVVLLILPALSSVAQNKMYLVTGYGFESYKNTDAISKVVADYNQFKLESGMIPEDELSAPGSFSGLVLGIKTRFKNGGAGVQLHFAHFVNRASGSDSLFNNPYFMKIKIGNAGIAMQYSYHLINQPGFHSGPAFALNVEKFRMYCRDNKAYGTTAYEKPVDKFMMGISLKWPLSFGKSKFNFDIIPYYTLPFWKVDATLFNTEELNFGHAKPYTTEQMTINPVRWGVAVTLNFLMMEEDD